MTPEAVRRLYDYHEWAFDRTWACITHLNDEQFTAPVEFSMGAVRNHVVHMMSGSRRWLDRLQGREVSPHLPFEDYPTRDLTRAKWDELRAERTADIRSFDQQRLDKMIEWSLPQRGSGGTCHRWEILLHLANHLTDHRAQVMTLLHVQFHVETVEQDMILYLAEGAK